MGNRLRAIAEETVAITDRGWYETPAGRVDIGEVSGTRLYLPEDALTLPEQKPENPRVEVTNESTLAAARRLGGDVACLVFASARNPGGGFLNGAQAQEESIARGSALYRSLNAAKEFYTHHRTHDDLTYSDRVIHSPDVPVFRDDAGALLPQPYRVSFLTAAAPNRTAVVNNQPERAASIPAILARRAERVLQIAAAHGHQRLVLGAWGCGVFGNDPGLVATTFRDALQRNRFFSHVVFAVLDGRPGTPTFTGFADVIG